MHLFTGSSVHSCTSPCMYEYRGQPIEIINRISCSNLHGKNTPSYCAGSSFPQSFQHPSIHPAQFSCGMTLPPPHSRYLCQQVRKIQSAAWSAWPHLERRQTSWTHLPSVFPVSQSPEQLPAPVPTEQCSTQITRWPYYVAVITTDIPALHKPLLSCSAMLCDYLNKNVSHGDSSPWLTPCLGQRKRSGDAVNFWKDVRKAQLRTEKWMGAMTQCLVQDPSLWPAYKLCLWEIHLGFFPPSEPEAG